MSWKNCMENIITKKGGTYEESKKTNKDHESNRDEKWFKSV